MRFTNIILSFIILSFIINCSITKSVYEEGSILNKDDLRTKLLNKKFNIDNPQKSLIVFASNFNNLVSIANKNNIIFKDTLITMESLGFSGAYLIEDNNKDADILIDGKKISSLKSTDLKRFKFVYVEKNNSKYIITYTNKPWSFK